MGGGDVGVADSDDLGAFGEDESDFEEDALGVGLTAHLSGGFLRRLPDPRWPIPAGEPALRAPGWRLIRPG